MATRKGATSRSSGGRKKTASRSTGSRGSTGRRTTRQKDAIALLKADHKEVKELFKKFKAAGARATKRRTDIMTKVCDELEIHAQVEESLVYPILERIDGGMVKHAEEEHAKVKQMIADLREMTAEDEEAEELMMELMRSVQEHVREEEKEMLPQLKDAVEREELLEVGKRAMEMKRQAKGGRTRRRAA